MEQLNAKIFYSPVKDPKEIKEIPIEDDKDLEIVDNSVEDIVRRTTKKPKNNINGRKFIDFMGKGLEVNHEDVKEFFEFISEHLYGKAREPQKYLVLITTNKYSFIYHLELEEAISFEKKSIRKFMKYLDSSNLLRFIYRSSDGHFRIYDKYNTKGWKSLLGPEPEYEAKGNVKVRIERSDKTDIVVETYIDDLENIKGTIEFRWEDKKASIKKVSDAKITEVIIDGKKFDPKAVPKKIKYKKLGIGKFMAEYNYQVENGEIRESKRWVHVNDKLIPKPEEELNGMEETYFILGSRVKSEDLVEEMKDRMKSVPNLGFVELNRFNNSYNIVKIGDFEIFGKIRSYEEVKELLDQFNTIISKLKEKENLVESELIRDVGLLSLCEYLESEGFKLKIQKAVKEKLKEDFKKKGIEEIDELGIELKSREFFGKSTTDFLKKSDNLRKLLPKRENKIRICLIGVNEDKERLDPIPLSRMRNENLKELKEKANKDDIKIPLIKKVPIDEKGGVLIIVLYDKKEDSLSKFF